MLSSSVDRRGILEEQTPTDVGLCGKKLWKMKADGLISEIICNVKCPKMRRLTPWIYVTTVQK